MLKIIQEYIERPTPFIYSWKYVFPYSIYITEECIMGKLAGEPELTCTLTLHENQKIVKLYEKFRKKLGAYVYKFFTLMNFFRIK